MTVVLALDHPFPEPSRNSQSTSSAELDQSNPPDLPSRTSLLDLRADRLSYLADMINELQVMAHETQCHTLAGILGLAHAEARQQKFGRAP